MTDKIRGIALFGTKHSGKSTCASIAVEKHGYFKLSLADPLKFSAVDMLNDWLYAQGLESFMTRELLDYHKDEYFVPLLQWLGSDWARRFLERPTYWIDAFLRDAAYINDLVVCDDLRYLNEAQALRDAGFVIIRVLRDEDDRLASLAAANAGGIAGHASETELESIEPDLTIYNSGLDALALAIEHIASMIALDAEPTVMEFVV